MSEQIARQFHEVYERLAPQFRYETRTDTKVFDPQSQNGRLMIAVCAEVIGAIKRQRDDLTDQHDFAMSVISRLWCERDRWKMQAEQKWGMRREIEELLGVKDTESGEQFAKALAALRDLITERNEAIEPLSANGKDDQR